ncbi:MAG: PIG-L deacetylase family protein [Planctomycetota bacterium]|jgi:LmbE family N-acetylglucosaminyl deacetylase
MSEPLHTRAAKSLVRGARRALIRHAGFIFASHLPVTRQPALVVAPHPDDEVLGAGGLIALKRTRGAVVHVLYLTDGEAALRDFGADPDDVARRRRVLGEKACATLGVEVGCLHRLHLPDGAVPSPESACFGYAVGSVRQIIERYGIHEVYCTHPADGWNDHTHAAAIARAAVGGADEQDGQPVTLHDYPVWSWFSLDTPGVVRMGWGRAHQINIDPVAHQKQHAIRQYLGAVDPVSKKPYCGVLPDDLLRAMNWTHELFFRVPDEELAAAARNAVTGVRSDPQASTATCAA